MGFAEDSHFDLFLQRSEVKDLTNPVLLGHRRDLEVVDWNPLPSVIWRARPTYMNGGKREAQ